MESAQSAVGNPTYSLEWSNFHLFTVRLELLIFRFIVTGIKYWYLFLILSILFSCFIFNFFPWDSAQVDDTLKWIPEERVITEVINNKLVEHFHGLNKNTSAYPPLPEALTASQLELLPWDKYVHLTHQRHQITLPFNYGSPTIEVMELYGPFVESNYSIPVDSLDLDRKLQDILDLKSNFFKLSWSILGGVFVTLTVCAGLSLSLNSGMATFLSVA